jgi:hypothetical protein
VWWPAPPLPISIPIDGKRLTKGLQLAGIPGVLTKDWLGEKKPDRNNPTLITCSKHSARRSCRTDDPPFGTGDVRSWHFSEVPRAAVDDRLRLTSGPRLPHAQMAAMCHNRRPSVLQFRYVVIPAVPPCAVPLGDDPAFLCQHRLTFVKQNSTTLWA